MPCSRSASRPSVRSERSMALASAEWPAGRPERRSVARAIAASWSARMPRLSNSSRPMSVLLPSSTLPAVMKRSTPRSSSSSGGVRAFISEISFALAPFHRRIGSLVVHARGASLGDVGSRCLDDDLGNVRGDAFDGAGAGDVADSAKPHRDPLDRFAGLGRRQGHDRNEQAAPAHDLAPMREIEAGQRQALAFDVLPDVELGPVGDGKDAQVLARMQVGVVEVPALGPLVLRIPLAEAVTKREHALLGTRLLFVAAGAAAE